MTTRFISHRFPTVALSKRQIVYVTDNDRDTEALSCEMELPVVTEPRFEPMTSPDSPVVLRQTSRTPKTPETSRTFQASGTPGTSRTSEQSGTSKTSGASETSQASEPSAI